MDLGGTRIKIGIVEDGKILVSSLVEVSSKEGLRPRLKEIDEATSSLLSNAKVNMRDIAGIGMSMPGIVDSQAMRVLIINDKYSDAIDFDFKKWAQDNFGLPLVLENDARAALVGEWKFGQGKGCNNLVMVTLGTGFGSAAVMEGTLLRGVHFEAGILGGHFTIHTHGERCNCGNVGCVEAEASSWNLPSLARRDPAFQSSLLSKLKTIDYENVFVLAHQDDRLSKEIVDRSLAAWTSGIINLIYAYDPERVILGGGIMRSADAIIPFIRDRVDKLAWAPWGKVEIVKARDMDNAALLGMSYLVKEKAR
jgi:glucokinase